MIVMVISLIPVAQVTALEITEVEVDPEGKETTTEIMEWVELYSNEKIDLEGYYLENNDKDIWNLTGETDGYLVIKFTKRWLDNDGNERVFLKDKNGNVIDETENLDDGKNDKRSWNKCDNEWVFVESTPGEENDCDSENSDDIPEDEQDESDEDSPDNNDDNNEEDNDRESYVFDDNDENDFEEGESSSQNQFLEISERKRVVLNSPSIQNNPQINNQFKKKGFIAKEEFLREYLIYLFVALVMLFALIISWKKI